MGQPNGAFRLRIAADEPGTVTPKVREALDALAAAISSEDALGDDVAGYAIHSQIEIGSLAPKPGSFPTRPGAPDSGLICLGFSWPSDGDPTCGVFW